MRMEKHIIGRYPKDLVVKNDSIFGLDKGSKIPKNSLLENIIMEKVNKELKNSSDFLFFSGYDEFTIIRAETGYLPPVIIDFLQKSKIKDKTHSAFLIFEKTEHTNEIVYEVHIPASIESFLLFYQTIYSNEDKPIDVIYKLARKALYGTEN